MTFTTYVVLSMNHQQKLIDKILAGDYKTYKQEQRADEMQAAQIEIEKNKQEENVDPDYL